MRHRTVVQEFFSRSNLNEEGMVSDIANNLISRVKDKRRMEFMPEFATRLPLAVVDGNVCNSV